jgi:hypothetical protein
VGAIRTGTRSGPSAFITAAVLCTVALAVIGLATLAGGCHGSRTSESSESGPAVRTVRVSRAKLFGDDFQRLEPRLGLTASGAVRLDAPGPDLFVGFVPEVWRAGLLSKSPGSGDTRAHEPSEVSFSLREVVDPTGRRVYRLVTAVVGPSDKSSMTFDVAIPEPGKHGTRFCTQELDGPREIAEGEVIPVWGYVIPEGNGSPTSLEEAIKTSRWALIVKLRWGRAEGR